MIRSFLNDPNEKKDIPLDDVKVKENIDTINSAMKIAKFKRKDLEKLEIQPQDVQKMKQIVPLLDFLEEGITLMGAEKYSTGSVVLPFLKRYEKVLQLDDNDPLYLSQSKRVSSGRVKSKMF